MTFLYLVNQPLSPLPTYPYTTCYHPAFTLYTNSRDFFLKMDGEWEQMNNGINWETALFIR